MRSVKKKKDHNTLPHSNGSLRGDPNAGFPMRQRYWSGKEGDNPVITSDFNLVLHPDAYKSNGFVNKGQPTWGQSSSSDKEGSYQPFKLITGRNTPLEDPYQSEIAPQDPIRTFRPPSRTASLCSGYRRSEGSAVYQPLTPTWNNSLLFNKQPSELYADFLPVPPMPPPAHTVPAPPVASTLPFTRDNLHPLSENDINVKVIPFGRHANAVRRSSISSGKQPGGLAYTSINGYISTGAPPEAYQLQKPPIDKPNKVILVPDGKVLGEPSLCSSQLDDNISLASDYGREFFNLRIFLKVSTLHLPLGLCLFALGIARLLLYSVWGLGIEVVYGIYVVFIGIVGIIGAHRRNFCAIVACFSMSMMSCIFCIPPFISGKILFFSSSSSVLVEPNFNPSHIIYVCITMPTHFDNETKDGVTVLVILFL